MGTRVMLIALALLTVTGVCHADPTTGVICVAPLPRNAREIDHDMPGGVPQRRQHSYEFTIQVDDGQRVRISTSGEPTLIDGLDYGKRHLVTIRDGQDVIESFWFSFPSRGSSRLCLEYGPWYQTWLLDPPAPKNKACRCDVENQ